jgi:hypothetical protein
MVRLRAPQIVLLGGSEVGLKSSSESLVDAGLDVLSQHLQHWVVLQSLSSLVIEFLLQFIVSILVILLSSNFNLVFLVLTMSVIVHDMVNKQFNQMCTFLVDWS